MTKLSKKGQRVWLVSLIVLCLIVILVGGIRYVSRLRSNLANQAIQNVMTVTAQQQQAFDNFIAGDQERLHSFAEYFSNNDISDPEEVQRQLTLFNDVDAIYSVMCLDDGWFCSNSSESIRQVAEEDLAYYSTLSGSGVRDSYIGLFSGEPKFGYYEAFTFADGCRGVIQKSYDRTKVSDTFSLSFYNDQGLAYVVNEKGEILLRSVGMMGDHLYTNILDVLTGTHGRQDDIDSLMAALEKGEAGSTVFTGEMGSFVYTYVPMDAVDEWFLVSVVPMSAITEETDQILLDSKVTLGILAAVLVICGVSIMLIWRTYMYIMEKDRKIEYQEQLFNIFSTYLSSNTNDVYMMVDAERHEAEYVSPNVERVLGFTPENTLEGLKSNLVKILSPEGMEEYPPVADMELDTALEVIKTERINPKTGEHRWFQESVYCTLVQGRRKIVIYISDRTQERNAQNTLAEALQMAQVANEAKSTFLSSVSHDSRTPLNAIIGFISLLKEEPDNPDQVLEYAQRIDAASQHLLGLINDVLRAAS